MQLIDYQMSYFLEPDVPAYLIDQSPVLEAAEFQSPSVFDVSICLYTSTVPYNSKPTQYHV